MNNRERRQWTSREDELLRMAVNLEDPGSLVPSKWNAIAQHVPNRTNKDCRKRWHAKMRSTDVVNGGWKPTEDQRLFNAVERYGTRWSVVAPLVKTRNSDQCAKRWWDTLNPAIDRTAWTAEADETLIQAVNEHGKVWTQIAQMYFPGRTGLAAKNRYKSIIRSNQRGASRRRHSSDTPQVELDISDRYYIPSASQFSGYHSHSTSHMRQQTAHPTATYHGRLSSYFGSYSMPLSALFPSAFASQSRNHGLNALQYQPPTMDPKYPMGNQSQYFPQSPAYQPPGSAGYQPSSQYAQSAITLPSNNPAVSEYSPLAQARYLTQQQPEYPSATFNPVYDAAPAPPIRGEPKS